MLGKLMKYEFKATSRMLLPINGAMLLFALINRLFMELNFFQTSNISVICVLQINQRFFQLFFQRIDIKTGDFRRIVNHLNI